MIAKALLITKEKYISLNISWINEIINTKSNQGLFTSQSAAFLHSFLKKDKDNEFHSEMGIQWGTNLVCHY